MSGMRAAAHRVLSGAHSSGYQLCLVKRRVG